MTSADAPPGYGRRTFWSMASLLLFAGVLFGASVLGTRSRAYASPRRALVVRSPEEASRVWSEAGVHGRTLLLFDRYPHSDAGVDANQGEPRSPASFVEHGVFHNVIRRVYLVVPDEAWDAFRGQRQLYQPLRGVPGNPEGLYLFTISGVPLIAVAAAALPPLREDPLVYVDASLFEPAWVGDLLARKGIATDLLVTRQRGAGE